MAVTVDGVDGPLFVDVRLYSLYCIITRINSIFIAPCPLLADPANGAVSVTGFSFEDSATFTCDSGYELVGLAFIGCGSDGSWSGQPPICRRKLHFTSL